MQTQAIDSATWSVEQCRRWLAGQLCLDCIDGLLEQMCDCGDGPDLHMKKHEACGGLGLAFPWASEECGNWVGLPGKSASCQEGGGHEGHNKCNGSGRVPKAVGLEELFKYGLIYIQKLPTEWEAVCNRFTPGIEKATSGVKAKGETPLLAALRAIVA